MCIEVVDGGKGSNGGLLLDSFEGIDGKCHRTVCIRYRRPG